MTPIEIARVCHEANRALQIIIGDSATSPPWNDAPEWQRESAVAGVRAALEGASPAQLHADWCELKWQSGWVFGEVKDADAKTHPCLVPYDELPFEQKTKDHLFGAIVAVLG